MGKTSQAQLKAVKKYNEKNTRQILMRLNSSTDADILELLKNSGNKQGTIKAALREYMKKQQRAAPQTERIENHERKCKERKKRNHQASC